MTKHMTTSKPRSTKSVSTTTHAPSTSNQEILVMNPTTPTTTMTPPAPPTPEPAAPPVPLSVDAPPADANIPVPPATFKPTEAGQYRGMKPTKAEQAVLPGAIGEVKKLPSFALLATVLGMPQAQFAALLTLGMQWTHMRNASSAWDVYCRTMEGIVWSRIRVLLARLTPVFDAMAASDATLTSQNAAFADLLGAKKVAAKKGVSARQLNAKAIAEGKPPTHGKAGKRAQRAAEKAALAAAKAAQANPPATSPAPAPVAVTPPPAATEAPAPPATNGAPHA